MSVSLNKNIGAYLHAAYAAASTPVTAGGSGDNVAVAGVSVDRFAQGLPLSASVIYAVAATMAATKTLSMATKIEHSSDNATWSDLANAVVANAVVLTANGGGTAQAIVVKQDVNLNGAKQYVRVNFTPDLSAVSTDTATITPIFVFGGMNELP